MVKSVHRISLTVFFDGQFWVGLFEASAGKKLSVCRYVFGAEPKDSDIFDLIINHRNELRFSPAVESEIKPITTKNPKVLQRKIRAMIESDNAVGTKAQQAIKLQTEQRAVERKKFNKERKEAESEEQYALRQEKKKEKKKGH